jgi:hypothetical protein
MSDTQLIEMIKAGNAGAAEDLLNSGADVNQQDEHGWTPLNWAAGRGDVAVINLLLERGADVLKVGRDQRSPYRVALAAGRLEAARLLREAESRAAGSDRAWPERNYSKAYLIKDLRAFAGWREEEVSLGEKDDESDNGSNGAGTRKRLDDDDIAFLHQDLTVTASMWPEENVIFDHVTPEWEEYCRATLKFEPPDDLQLIVETLDESSAQPV